MTPIGAPGILFAGWLGAEAGMSAAWRWLSVVIAIAGVVLAVLALLRAFPFDQYVLGLTGGILVPIWAIWLAMRAPGLWGLAGETEPAAPMATEGGVAWAAPPTAGFSARWLPLSADISLTL